MLDYRLQLSNKRPSGQNECFTTATMNLIKGAIIFKEYTIGSAG